MLLYTARLAALAITENRKARVGVLDEVPLAMRAMPWDCDNNRHVNNARYGYLMDFGRTAWIVRIGLLDAVVKGGLHFLVGSSHLVYRRPVDLFEAFTLRTRLVSWDERWVYIAQEFELEGRVAVRGLIRAMARNADGLVEPARLLGLGGAEVLERPELPEEFRRWIETCNASLEAIG